MRKLTLVFSLLLLFSASVIAQAPFVDNLRCELKKEPLGIEVRAPRLSWEIRSEKRNLHQSAYQIRVCGDLANLSSGKGLIWDSGKIVSSSSVQVSYHGPVLLPAKTYYWEVRVWDGQGNVSPWSKPASWQSGLFSAADWKGAQWIAYEKLPENERIVPAQHGKGDKTLKPVSNVLPLLRKSFYVKSPLKRATAFISGLGQFEMSVNGKKAGDHFLDPAWTKYDKEAVYVTFDVTSDLKPGKNALGVMLGNGFYFQPRDKRYRKLTGAYGYPKMICRLQLEYQNGAIENIVSNSTWRTSSGPVTYSSIYGGEDYDARREKNGWSTADYNDKDWKSVVLVQGPPVLKSQMADPVKIFDSFEPVLTKKISEGIYVFDLGQNASGIPSIAVQGKRGDTVRIIPAELLNEDGTANQKSTGKPVYYDYVLKGEGVESWQPRFTYYGLRYLQIEGISLKEEGSRAGLATLQSVRGLHIRNAAEPAGEFGCSSDLFNRTSKLIDWAIRSNMMSIFTDCPHRERLGWQEEVHLMGNSIRYNYQIANLGKKVLNDIKTAQTPEGLIPATVPEYTVMDFANGVFRDSPEWGSNGVILPWYLYQWYGDRDVLQESYSMMQRYVNYLGSKASGHIVSYGLSDWYDIGPERSGFSQMTPMGLTATAYYYYDLTIMQKVAALLGRSQDAEKYRALASEVRKAFNTKFFDKDKVQYGTGSQTSNAMAVYMGLVEPQFKEAVVGNIVKDIRSRNNSLTSGDIGFRYLIQVLAEAGRSDVIFDMNSNPDVPGYGYQLAKGATALTESWVASPIVSNNHLMLGHILEWFYGNIAGIRPAEDAIAFNHIIIAPEPVGNLRSAQGKYQSPYGLISSDWKKTEKSFELNIKVPGNTKATVCLPAGNSSGVYLDDVAVEKQQDVKVLGLENGKLAVEVGSGTYRFLVNN